MPSLITVMSTDKRGDVCALDSRYGRLRECYSRADANEMARLDELIEVAGIVPGDRIELRVKMWVKDEEARRVEEKEMWVTPSQLGRDAVFMEIDNGRFRVQETREPKAGGVKSSWALFNNLYEGTKCVLEVRKERPVE